MLPERGCAVELQRAIDLEEMEVRANLHRTIAGVAHLEGGHCQMLVEIDGLGAAHVPADSYVRLRRIIVRGDGWIPF